MTHALARPESMPGLAGWARLLLPLRSCAAQLNLCLELPDCAGWSERASVAIHICNKLVAQAWILSFRKVAATLCWKSISLYLVQFSPDWFAQARSKARAIAHSEKQAQDQTSDSSGGGSEVPMHRCFRIERHN